MNYQSALGAASNSASLLFEKIDHSVFHILPAPQQCPGLLFQYPAMITLPAKGDGAAVMIKAEHRLEKKDASLLPQMTTVLPVDQRKEIAGIGVNNLS